MRRIILVFILVMGLTGLAWADVRVAGEQDLLKIKAVFSAADVAIGVAERTPGYLSKWNSVQFLPVEGQKNIYGQKILIGGTNNAAQPLSFVALIPLYEYRGIEKAQQQIISVTVNGQLADCFLFMPGQDAQSIIDTAAKVFPSSQSLKSSFDQSAPILFINAGKVNPGQDLRIEYELKPQGMILN